MRIKLLILTYLYLFLGAKFVFAEFTFTIPSTTITPDEELETTITLSLQGQNNKNYYLEGAFKKGSSNYFGLTWNDSSWVQYTSSDFSTLKLITTDTTGKWSGIAKIKIDKDSSLFSGSGIYTLRIKRFTTGGSGTWADNSIDLEVNAPSPIPTATPTPTPSPSPSPTSTPTSTPTPTPSNSVSKTKTTSTKSNTPAPTVIQPTPIPSINDTKIASVPVKSLARIEYKVASVAATTTSATPYAKTEVKNQKQINPILVTGIIFIFAGVGSIGYIYLKKRRQ